MFTLFYLSAGFFDLWGFYLYECSPRIEELPRMVILYYPLAFRSVGGYLYEFPRGLKNCHGCLLFFIRGLFRSVGVFFI